MPENSIAAFEHAVLQDYAIELDVRLTDDNVPIVFHDETLKRMTQADGYISNVSSSELKNYKLLTSAQTIPTLSEVLEVINGRVPLVIELKNHDKVGVMESKVNELLSDYKGEFAVTSFNPFSLEYFKNKSPGFLRGLIAMNFSKEEQPSFIKRHMLNKLKYLSNAKPDFLCFRASDLPNRFATKSGLPILAWTVNSNGELEKILPHCNNIIFEKFIPNITKEFGRELFKETQRT